VWQERATPPVIHQHGALSVMRGVFYEELCVKEGVSSRRSGRLGGERRSGCASVQLESVNHLLSVPAFSDT